MKKVRKVKTKSKQGKELLDILLLLDRILKMETVYYRNIPIQIYLNSRTNHQDEFRFCIDKETYIAKSLQDAMNKINELSPSQENESLLLREGTDV